MFPTIDFQNLEMRLYDESTVREEIITPILHRLNYTSFGKNNCIIREKALSHPYVQIGSKRQPLINFPDYLLKVKHKYRWALDAKAPKENIRKEGKNRQQAYFYAIHSEVRVDYYALCNGLEFILFHISKTDPLLYFHIEEIETHWKDLESYLSPDSFIQKDLINPQKNPSIQSNQSKTFDYLSKTPPKEILKVQKNAAKRHFGPHGYFTRQSWDVLQTYIKRFSQKGDVVFDPFGGKGTTCIEALILGRQAIHIDLNPLSVFITKTLIEPIDFSVLQKQFDIIYQKLTKYLPRTKEEFQEVLKKYPFPKNIPLPKNANVKSIEELFTEQQLAQLAYLKSLIKKVKDISIQNTLLLAFSSTLTKINRTYHVSKTAKTGDSGIFRYYSYRIAPKPTKEDLMHVFKVKYEKVVSAKKDICSVVTSKEALKAQVYRGDASDLSRMDSESVDYIYTDPPYGSNIAYLDLSTMWNAWLDFEITKEDRKQEAIEGGSLKKSSDEYADLLKRSIRELYRILKFNRWMSFVFAHKDPHYWHLIVEQAEKVGFEYAGAVKQNNGQTTFKKRKNPSSVLSGQLIINFRKIKTPEIIQKIDLGADIYALIIETIESAIAEHNGATLEQINDRLILTGLENGFLHTLSKEYKDLTPILKDNFVYDSDAEVFCIKKNFKTTIPLDVRIRYFLLSYLKRKEKEDMLPTTDEIILDIMPLLKNGLTPKDQTILTVLRTIAQQIEKDRWKLLKDAQKKFF